jgi:SAM-dependent methyltransferase
MRDLKPAKLLGRARGVAASIRDVGAGQLLGRPPPLPPAGLRFMGEDDARFMETGDQLVRDVRRWAGLTDGGVVVDVGSGYGRFAHALLRGGFRGEYFGFDILPRHVRWCQAHLTRLIRPRVRFGHLDVANARYNPKGKIRGEEVAFPVASRSADAVLLASVFTHMDEDHIFRYLSEARRVLKVGGRVLASFFLLEPQWAEAHAAGTTAYPMVHVRSPHCRYADAADPLFAIGYDLEWMVARVTELGLRLAEPPRLGQWARRAGAETWQDFLVLER